MSKKLHVIYIPGIGDDTKGLQSKVVKTWKWWGVSAELISMEWADDVAWETKFQRLLDHVDELAASGRKVALVGASAGGSAVINAFAARPDIAGVVCIAGKINRPESIGARYRQNNPSFVESAYQCQETLKKLGKLERQRVLSRYGLADEVVPKRDSRITGAHNRVVPSVGHGLTIATQIVFGAPGFLRFLKKAQDSL